MGREGVMFEMFAPILAEQVVEVMVVEVEVVMMVPPSW